MLQPPGTVSEMRTYLRDKGGAPVTPERQKKQREAAEMRAQGVSLRNIAKSLNTSKSTVERWLDDSDKSQNCPKRDTSRDTGNRDEQEKADEGVPASFPRVGPSHFTFTKEVGRGDS